MDGQCFGEGLTETESIEVMQHKGEVPNTSNVITSGCWTGVLLLSLTILMINGVLEK